MAIGSTNHQTKTVLKKNTVILAAFILLKFILQYGLIGPEYALHRDEYLHLDQGRHLAWGYESVPPFTSWISWLILQLGNGVFWVKFFPALFGALTLLVVWKTVEMLKGNLFALVLSATAITFSAILRINILYQPNSFDILCWTLFYFTLIKYVNSKNDKWIYAAALVFAFGFLNKYNIIFLAAGLFPALLLSEQRKLLLTRTFYFAAAIALIIVSPNLLWQYQHHFPVVHHLKELADTQLANVNRAGFLKEQLLFFFNSFFIVIAAFISFFTFPAFRKYHFLWWAYFFTILIFTYLKAKSYYAIGLYPIFFAFGSVYLEILLNKGWKLYLRPVLILFVVVLFLFPLKYIFPLLSPAEIANKNKAFTSMGLLRWEDGKQHMLPQDFADMLGWNELAHKTDSIYASLPDKSHTLVLCDNYGQTGAINYYSKQKLQAVSFNADYINWFPLDKMEIKNIILVKESKDDDPGRETEKPFFEKVLPGGQIENKYAREFGTKIYLLLNAKTDINSLLQQIINKRKKEQE
jgi:hypothetical protein